MDKENGESQRSRQEHAIFYPKQDKFLFCLKLAMHNISIPYVLSG